MTQLPQQHGLENKGCDLLYGNGGGDSHGGGGGYKRKREAIQLRCISLGNDRGINLP